MKNSFVNKRKASLREITSTPKRQKPVKTSSKITAPTLINTHTLKKWINHIHSTSTLYNYITAQAPNEMVNVQKG